MGERLDNIRWGEGGPDNIRGDLITSGGTQLHQKRFDIWRHLDNIRGVLTPKGDLTTPNDLTISAW